MASIDVNKALSDYGLSEEQYEQLIKDCEDKLNGMNDYDWSDLVKKYNLNVSNDFLRKSFTGLIGGANIKQYYQNKKNDSKSCLDEDYITELDEKKRELERAKVQYRDAKNAWQKQNYNDSRLQENLDILEEKIENIGFASFESHSSPTINSDNDLIVMLSDLHIGTCFSNSFGKYDSDIAKDRLQQYLDEIIRISNVHKCENCYVVGIGDLINGNIRLTVQLSNRENLIEQVKLASSLITSFCYELTKYFKNVYYAECSGNHSRVVTNKDDAVHDERLDNLISWIVVNSLSHIDNFHSIEDMKFDVGIVGMKVKGNTYIAVHGDNDVNNKNGIMNLCSMIKMFPTAILRGHFHSPLMMEYNNIQIIQGGSLCGGGGTYEIEKRLTGKPSQTVLVCNADGIQCIYNVKLK